MATAYVTVAKVATRGPHDTATMFATPARSQTVTTSATSAQSTLVGTGGDVCQIWCATTVVATTGTNPTASLANGIVCPAGVATNIILHAGEVVALIDG